MKRIFSLFTAIFLVFAFSRTSMADDRRDGIAQLELRSGGLALLPQDRGAAGLPPEYATIGDISADFGTHALTGEPMSLSSSVPIGLIVQDARGLVSASAWRVTAQLGPFTGDNGSVSLKGAQLVLAADPASLVPAADTWQPAPESAILIPGAASGVPVFRSNPSEGSPGTWGANWLPTLFLPAQAESGTHQAILTWTLTAGE